MRRSHAVSQAPQGAFLREWLANPRRVASVAPSGRALAEAMTRGIGPDSAPVIELGPGTGAFTKALIAAGVPEERLALIELGGNFAGLLRFRYPRATVLALDATRLGSAELFGAGNAGAVVSGLPLIAMPPRAVMMILRGAFRQLRPGGGFVQFTYTPVCPVPRAILDRLGLTARRTGGAFVNLPPAAVWRIERAGG